MSFTTCGGPAGAAVGAAAGAAGAVAVWASVRLTIDKINTNDNVQMSILFIFFHLLSFLGLCWELLYETLIPNPRNLLSQ
jgi:hypothetical protein